MSGGSGYGVSEFLLLAAFADAFGWGVPPHEEGFDDVHEFGGGVMGFALDLYHLPIDFIEGCGRGRLIGGLGEVGGPCGGGIGEVLDLIGEGAGVFREFGGLRGEGGAGC